MSLGSFITKLFGTVEHIVVVIGKAELKIAKTSTLGVAIATAIKAGEAGTSPAQKMELAIASLLPTVETYISNPTALKTDIETLGKMMIEAALPILKDAVTGPLAILEEIAEKL